MRARKLDIYVRDISRDATVEPPKSTIDGQENKNRCSQTPQHESGRCAHTNAREGPTTRVRASVPAQTACILFESTILIL